MKERILLMTDALINLGLGLLLMLFPPKLVEALGAPTPESSFYANILGAVLFGIGVALLMELYSERSGMAGLGIGGAISINFCGAAILVLWLVFGHLDIPVRGYAFLWFIAILVLGVSLLEFFAIYMQERITA